MKSLTAFAAAVSILASCASEQQPPLPDVPDTNMLPVVAAQLADAHARALATPGDATTVGDYAMVLHCYGLLEPAIEAYARARVFDPREFRWAYLAAHALSEHGAIVEGIELFSRSTELQPDYFPARYWLAEHLRVAGELDEAQQLFQQLITTDPGRPEGYWGTGQIALRRGQIAEAIEAIRRTIELAGGFAQGHRQLAIAYARSGEPEKAQLHAQAAEVTVNARLAIADPQLAAVRRLDRSERPLIATARALASRGDYDAALDYVRRAIAINPGNALNRTIGIQLAGLSGDVDAARRYFDEATAINPDVALPYRYLGEALERADRNEEAEGLFREALSRDTTSAAARLGLARVLEEQGAAGEALREYREVLDADPVNRAARRAVERLD